MAMPNRSTIIKNHSSTAKRTASALRSLVESLDMNIADKGVLLTAAQIVDTISIRKAREAKEAKFKEEKYERDEKAARSKIHPAISAIPCGTIGEKVAAALLTSQYKGYLVKALHNDTPKELAWDLDYWSSQSKQDSEAHLAFCVATGKTTIDQAIESLRIKLQDVTQSAETASLTARFMTALDKNLVVAA